MISKFLKREAILFWSCHENYELNGAKINASQSGK